ncbi:hypothetical protein CO676_19785 [Sinorhizobium sp. BJ1]|nr:hypothetical protein CO676_19785 [Sinorhizobium sp. BJ1]
MALDDIEKAIRTLNRQVDELAVRMANQLAAFRELRAERAGMLSDNIAADAPREERTVHGDPDAVPEMTCFFDESLRDFSWADTRNELRRQRQAKRKEEAERKHRLHSYILREGAGAGFGSRTLDRYEPASQRTYWVIQAAKTERLDGLYWNITLSATPSSPVRGQDLTLLLAKAAS